MEAHVIAYWFGFIGGRFTAALMILSLVLFFVRNRTCKNIFMAGAAASLIATFIGLVCAVNGRLLTLSLFKNLLFRELLSNCIFIGIICIFVICFHLTAKKWFSQKLPLVAAILYGLLLCISLPVAIKEQYEIQKIARETTFKQWTQFNDLTKINTAYKMAGVKDARIFSCLGVSQDEEDLYKYLLRDVVEECKYLAEQGKLVNY